MRLLFITFLIFSFLFIFQIFTGIYLYIEKYGFSYSSASEYILGNEEKFINPKTFYGLLKLNFPHFLAIFLVVFVLSHFLYFFKIKNFYFFIAGMAFSFGFLDIISSFLMLKSQIFSYLKIISFLGFEISLFVILFILVLNIFIKLRTQSTENQ